jgi:uncharacterized protein
LRGIALLGIVVVNVPLLGLSFDGFTPASVEGTLNAGTAFAVIALAQGKFYLLFSLLFGYSAAFILRDGGSHNRRRFRRRLVGLGVIGLVHAVFFYIGDILISYAVLGLGLLAVSEVSDRALRRWAIVGLVAGVVLPFAFLGPLTAIDPNSLTGANDSALAALDEAMASGSFLDAAWARLQALPIVLASLFALQDAMAFGAFCLGLLLARRQALADPRARRATWRRWAVLGLAVGLPIQVAAAFLVMLPFWVDTTPEHLGAWGTALGFATSPVLAAGYLGLLGWALATWPGFASSLSAAGRMSLTVYVGESILLSLLFCGYGLGFFGQWGALAVTASGVAAWLALAMFARIWLGRRDQGPLEALLARWTGRRAGPATPAAP